MLPPFLMFYTDYSTLSIFLSYIERGKKSTLVIFKKNLQKKRKYGLNLL